MLGDQENRQLTTEESLHLDTPYLPSTTVPKDEAADAGDALSVNEKLELAVGLANIVEADTFTDGGPLACGELEGTTADRCTVGGIALGEWGNVAYFLVGGEFGNGVGGKVGVELAIALFTPHETGREASR